MMGKRGEKGKKMKEDRSRRRRSNVAPALMIFAGVLAAGLPGPAAARSRRPSQGPLGVRAVSQTRPAAPARPSGSARRPGAKSIAVIDGDPVIKLLPEDGIPAVDHPEMVPASQAGSFMRDDEMVLGVVDQGEARAYSTWHLDHHEIVNDKLGDTPIAATW